MTEDFSSCKNYIDYAFLTSLYYRVVVISAHPQGLYYTVKDAVYHYILSQVSWRNVPTVEPRQYW